MDVEKAIDDLLSIKKLGANGSPAHIKIDNAIQTIKELKNKSEEVCEWKIVDRPNGFPIFNTSCGAIRLACAKGIDIYCNACGKKIKVTE